MSNYVIYENLEDNQLVEKISQENDSGALRELVNRHTGVYNRIVQDFTSMKKHTAQDYLDDKFYTFYKAAKKFNPSKNMKFHVYLGQTIKFNCMRDTYAAKSKPILENIDEIFDLEDSKETYETDGYELVIKAACEIDSEFGEIMRTRLSTTNDKILSLKNVSDILGKKTSRTRNIYNKYIQILRDNLKNEQFNP